MPREPQRKPYQRNIEDRAKRLFVIATEGVKTEYWYFNTIKHRYNLLLQQAHIQLELLKRPSKQAGHSSPDKVRQMIEDFLEHNDFDYNTIETVRPNDTFWLVVDTDSWTDEQLQDVANFCHQKLPFHLAISNPCFEWWLILHWADLADPRLSDIEKALTHERSKVCKRVWNTTFRHDIKNAIDLPNLQTAIQRAIAVNQYQDTYYPVLFLTTTVYRVLQAMEVFHTTTPILP